MLGIGAGVVFEGGSGNWVGAGLPQLAPMSTARVGGCVSTAAKAGWVRVDGACVHIRGAIPSACLSRISCRIQYRLQRSPARLNGDCN